MSRKPKVGIDYFSHDVDMKDDKRIRLIIAKHGLIGYAVYCRLLEEIYRESGYFIFVDSDFTVLFSDDCKLDLDDFRKILDEMISKGLFNQELFEKFNILTSKRIQENYCSATERRKQIDFIEDYLLIDVEPFYNLEKVNVNINSVNVNINRENVDINRENVDISTQSKAKQSKVESKVNTSKKIFDDESREMKICKYFFAVLLKSKPNQNEPNWQNWCKDIALFLRVDKPSNEEIKTVINFAHDSSNATDKFSWIPNLRSPKKLREHFEKILLTVNQKDLKTSNNDGSLVIEAEKRRTQELLKEYE